MINLFKAGDMVTMDVSCFFYDEFRHWIKRHGWILMNKNYLNGIYTFCSIKPIYGDSQLEAYFSKSEKGGIKFDGYKIV